jgi:hypothetical protein
MRHFTEQWYETFDGSRLELEGLIDGGEKVVAAVHSRDE